MTLVDTLREPEGLRYNGGALAYAVVGYALGWAGLFHASLLVNLAAMLLLAHAMTIAAYLIHECGHNLVFKSGKDNARLGRILSWLCGAAYGTYEDMRYKHFRHHVDNDDVVWFDYEQFFRDQPGILRVTRFLEWFSPGWLAIRSAGAHAAVSRACSPEPPDMAPVRKSETKGQVPNMAGWPGATALT